MNQRGNVKVADWSMVCPGLSWEDSFVFSIDI